MDRRNFFTKLIKTSTTMIFGGSFFIKMEDQLKETTYKYFKLNFPKNHNDVARGNELMAKFWDLDKMDAITNEFIKSKKIIMVKQKLSNGSSESIMGFSSELAYLQWEKALKDHQCCDDNILKDLGFSFSMKTISQNEIEASFIS